MTVLISDHAIDEYRLLIAPVSAEEARAIMASAERGIEAACRFGAKWVVLGRARLLVRDGRVEAVTTRRAANYHHAIAADHYRAATGVDTEGGKWRARRLGARGSLGGRG